MLCRMEWLFHFFPKKAAFAWENWGVQDPVFPVMLVRTPEHGLGSSLLPGTQLILE